MSVRPRAAIRGPWPANTHLDSGSVRLLAGDGRAPITLCGRTILGPERLLWDQAAEEDRCGQCSRRVAAGEGS